MSSASMRTCWRTTAPSAAAPAAGAKKSGLAGSVSRTRRWRVQSPPRTTLLGMPGSGMMLPKAPPPPANSKAVT